MGYVSTSEDINERGGKGGEIRWRKNGLKKAPAYLLKKAESSQKEKKNPLLELRKKQKPASPKAGKNLIDPRNQEETKAIWRIAQDLNRSHELIIDFLRKRGYAVRGHLSQVGSIALADIYGHFQKDKEKNDKHRTKLASIRSAKYRR